MNDLQMVVAFASIFFGVTLRTLLPSLQKLQAGQKWDHTYTATAFIAVITSLVTAFLAFPGFSLPSTVEGFFGIFLISFVYGWGLNDFYNKILADLQTPATVTSDSAATSTSPPTQVQSTTPQGVIGTYKAWTVSVENTYLTMTPPQELVSRFGSKLNIGSLAGWPVNTNFLKMATDYIDDLLAIPLPDPTKQVITPPQA